MFVALKGSVYSAGKVARVQGAARPTTRAVVCLRPAAQSATVRLAPARSSVSDTSAPAPPGEPETAKEAIAYGNQLGKEGKWAEALAVYEKGLTLPGTGLKRYRDKPRLISDSEKMAVLFNIACCHSQLGDVRAGLVSLAGCLELGYADFKQLRTDPDLEALRKDERFEGLVKRFEPKGGFFGGLFGGQ